MGFNSEKVEWRSHWSQWPCSQLLQLRTAGFLRSMELHLRQCFGLDTGVAFTLFRLPMVGGRDLQQRPYGSHAYLPPATKLGQGYVFTRVCDSVQSGGSASVHAGIPPWEQAPPGSRNPPLGADPPWRPAARHAGIAPLLRSACWEKRSTSGRYASHWNAILVMDVVSR